MLGLLWHQNIALAEEDDDFYELQPADYFNLVSNRMAGTKYGFASLNLFNINLV